MFFVANHWKKISIAFVLPSFINAIHQEYIVQTIFNILEIEFYYFVLYFFISNEVAFAYLVSLP